MLLYGNAMDNIVSEVVQSELQIEQKVLDRFSRYVDVSKVVFNFAL